MYEASAIETGIVGLLQFKYTAKSLLTWKNENLYLKGLLDDLPQYCISPPVTGIRTTWM
jgi:hypothetical protein